MYHFSSLTGYKPLTFRHFGRKGYSLFAALGREVKVGVLTVATLSTAAPALAAASGRSSSVDAAPETSTDSLTAPCVNLNETTVIVTSEASARAVMTFSRDDIAAAGVTSINDAIKLCAGVDVRQRGAFGVQTDIAIDGGTFDQITILLNGVNISSPHTGHLSADFPVTALDIERIEVLEGAASHLRGNTAFNGAINIVTRSEQRGATVHGYGGMYGYGGGEARLSFPLKTGKGDDSNLLVNHFSGGYTRSDGATDNSQFSASRAFWAGHYNSPDLRIDYQLGYSYKPYGANTFYGAASTDQWESNERWMGAVSAETQTGRLHIKPKAYWNRWYDHYQWHKDSPAGENYHQVDVYGLALDNWFEWYTGDHLQHATDFGIEMRSEGIRSTKLGELLEESQWTNVHRGPSSSPSEGGGTSAGETFYSHAANRANISGHLEHNIYLHRWIFSAGLLAVYNTALDTRWRFYPGVDIAYRPTRRWALFASWNTALRMPTFTDLYYSGPGIEGTHNLLPERTSDFSLKARYTTRSLTADASAFYSHKTDMIDWVQTEVDGPFRSGNYTLDNVGLRLNASWQPRKLWGEAFPLRKVGVQYCWLNENISYPTPIVASKYAMEYMRNKLVVSADTRIFRIRRSALHSESSQQSPRRSGSLRGERPWAGGEAVFGLSYRYCDRITADSYGILDARLSWENPHYSVYVTASNLLNTEYYDYSIVRQPGLWIVGGVKVMF